MPAPAVVSSIGSPDSAIGDAASTLGQPGILTIASEHTLRALALERGGAPPRGGKLGALEGLAPLLNPTLGALAAKLEPLLLLAHPDSGCTGHVTPHRSRLICVKPCNDRFKAANGSWARATCIGDMPVIGAGKGGKPVAFTIKGVRCVPDFAYTLLSVDQLWQTQRIDSPRHTLPHRLVRSGHPVLAP